MRLSWFLRHSPHPTPPSFLRCMALLPGTPSPFMPTSLTTPQPQLLCMSVCVCVCRGASRPSSISKDARLCSASCAYVRPHPCGHTRLLPVTDACESNNCDGGDKRAFEEETAARGGNEFGERKKDSASPLMGACTLVYIYVCVLDVSQAYTSTHMHAYSLSLVAIVTAAPSLCLHVVRSAVVDINARVLFPSFSCACACTLPASRGTDT